MSPVAAQAQAPSEWLTRSELAARWNVPAATVRDWAVDRKGPRYAKFGRHVRYRLSDVVAWENEQMQPVGGES